MNILNITPRQKVVSKYCMEESCKTVKVKMEIEDISKNILNGVNQIEKINGGRCNNVFKVRRSDGEFVLKIAVGDYRKAELKNEHEIMSKLKANGSQVVLPNSILFYEEGDKGYQLQEYVKGKTVRETIKLSNGIDLKSKVFNKIGNQLSKIHNIRANDISWKSWIEGQLSLAKLNMENNLLDLDEFEEEENPEKVLEWLQNNIPKEGKVCLLHGDYRPKNIIWNDDEIKAIIDWGFIDAGDPYYDLAIIDYYFHNEELRAEFYKGYGLEECDRERLEYFEVLSKFINI